MAEEYNLARRCHLRPARVLSTILMVLDTEWSDSVGDEARTESGLPVQAVYGPEALDGFAPEAAIRGAPARN